MAGSKYRESGVDIDAANRAKKRIAELARETWGREVLSEIGNFGGLFQMPLGLTSPVLVSSVDGVGTKLKVAFLSKKHDTVGEDLVNHCVNDILVQGAEPLFFLDYVASGALDPEVVSEIVKGIAKACRENGCALIGGETAEMPGFYGGGEYDLAGCIIGVVERARVIDGRSIRPGDSIWAFPSSGLHTNGYSLARKIVFEEAKLSIDDELPGTGRSVREALLAVHRSYLPEIRDLRARVEVRGLAHITGGGLLENIPRILPAGTAVEIDASKWEVPPLFEFLKERGGVGWTEMNRVFNMGIGMVVIVPADTDEAVESGRYRWNPFQIGRVVAGDKKVHLVNLPRE
ncbi:MAG: phosphoribosylformylglycinamidine cyclo-ligase [Candidatus Krumholzibacteria bacterium]|nr:phosphoribosylformylglycinamidine cyclo-ligase [Candidatus Krumholzibacteria bacterium]